MRLLILPAILLNAPIIASAAVIAWDVPGSTGNWGTAGNWNPAQIPGAADTVDLTNAANSSTVININSAQELLDFSGTTGFGLISIQSGGSLTGHGTAASAFRAPGLSVVVENGGLFSGGSSSAQTLRLGNVTVDDGGQLDGFTIYQGTTVVNNGLLTPHGTGASNGVTLNASGGLSLTGSGVVRLDLFGDNNSESFIFGNTPTVDFSGFSSIELLPGYSVQAGDTFDLWDMSSGTLDNITFGDGSNIMLLNSPGLTLDTSIWSTDGVVTVVVPEPATIAWLLGAGAMIFVLMRRRKTNS